MKIKKMTAKERCLEKSKNLVAKLEGDQYVVIREGKAGNFSLGKGKAEDDAWRAAANFLGC